MMSHPVTSANVLKPSLASEHNISHHQIMINFFLYYLKLIYVAPFSIPSSLA